MVTGALQAERVRLGYGEHVVVDGLSVTVPDGELTVIVGPNACGKSTLLRGLSRLMRPLDGTVLLDGKAIHRLPAKQVARELGLLPQSPTVPDAITVADLVGRGRYPYQSLLRQWSAEDEAAVRSAMVATGVLDLADQAVDELSGGQRQRVWMAMVLAQETRILLLDEPTTFLDIAHQLEVLDLCAGLRDGGRTVVAVLHDLNLACRYATHLVAMSAGEIVAEGPPAAIVTPALIERLYGIGCRVIDDPETGTPLVVPRRSGAAAVAVS